MSVVEFAEGLMHILEDNGYEVKACRWCLWT